MTGTSIKTLLAIALLVGAASQAHANTWHHVKTQAEDILAATKILRVETAHYRHTPYYGKLISVAAKLKANANSVNSIARYSHDAKALKYAVQRLDQTFLQAEQLIDQIECDAAYGKGIIPSSTAHIKQLLHQIHVCINYLHADVHKLAKLQHKVQQKVKYKAPAKVPHYSKQGYSKRVPYSKGTSYRKPYGGDIHKSRVAGSRGGSISIGGGKSKFTIRW